MLECSRRNSLRTLQDWRVTAYEAMETVAEILWGELWDRENLGGHLEEKGIKDSSEFLARASAGMLLQKEQIRGLAEVELSLRRL